MTTRSPAWRALHRAGAASSAAVCALLLSACWCGATPAGASRLRSGAATGLRGARAADSISLSDLPLHEVAPRGPGTTMAVLLTGDGGWAPADRALASALAAHGVPVVSLDSRTYLAHGQTAERLGSDMRRILRHYCDAWQRAQVIVIGYSRGADMAPFMVSRLPEDLRRRVVLVSLLGPGERTSFKFHWPDLVLSLPQDANIPVRPELEKLRGLPMQCIYGRKDGSAICPKLDPALARIIVREDHGHRILSDEADWLATTILGGVKPD